MTDTNTKIEIRVGNIEFSGEGDQVWLGTQLDKILKSIPELLKSSQLSMANIGNEVLPILNPTGSIKIQTTNLALFLKDKGATVNQTKKFLATAAFIQSNGKGRQTTTDVAKALKDANQTKLNNASDCLNQNLKKGFCERDGKKEFFVTEAGTVELGN